MIPLPLSPSLPLSFEWEGSSSVANAAKMRGKKCSRFLLKPTQMFRYTSGSGTREFNRYAVIKNSVIMLTWKSQESLVSGTSRLSLLIEVIKSRGLHGGRENVRSRAALTASVNSTKVAESQLMTHIVVERNRRRLMNDHLAALRSLMPPPFVQRGDQASVIGGAIDFVKELEQVLLLLLAEKRQRKSTVAGTPSAASTYARPSRDPAARRTSAPRWRRPPPARWMASSSHRNTRATRSPSSSAGVSRRRRVSGGGGRGGR